MFIRTYLRTLFNNIFKNNPICKIFTNIVNFYFKLWFTHPKNIKFSPNMSIKDMEENKLIFFQSVTGDKIDCK